MKKRRNKGWLSAIMFCSLIMFILSGCSNEHEIKTSSVAGITPDYQISINDDGTVNVDKQAGSFYDFDKWEGIKSVVFGIVNAGGLKDDGTVIVTGYNTTGADEVQDWRNIENIAFTAFATYGLNKDGTIIYTGKDHQNGITDFEKKIMSDVDTWKDIVDIKGAQLILAGITKDGSVLVSAPSEPEMEEGVKDWRNIKDISVSMTMILGVTWSGEVLCVYDSLTNEWSDKNVLLQYKDLKGAEKVYAGQSFVAGLMQDGTFKIRIVTPGYQDEEDLVALDGMADIKDASNYEEYLAIMKNDGSVITAGYID